MIYVLYFVHVIVSIFLILVVLLQQGKGADLSVFGGGATQAAFGARGSVNILHRLTVACFVLFILTTLSIGLMQARGNPSLMRGFDAEEVTETPAPALAPEPAPGASPSEAQPSEAQPSLTEPAPADGADAEAADAAGAAATTPAEEPPPAAESDEPPPDQN